MDDNTISVLDLGNGHTLIAKASAGDYPQIEVYLDSPENIVFATEYQEDAPTKKVFKTYFYSPRQDSVEYAYEQNASNFFSE